jgi:hypothetical protein
VERGRKLFERASPLPDAWHFYEARDAAVLALTEERDKVAKIPWLAWDPECFGQQTSGVPTITRKRLTELQGNSKSKSRLARRDRGLGLACIRAAEQWPQTCVHRTVMNRSSLSHEKRLT